MEAVFGRYIKKFMNYDVSTEVAGFAIMHQIMGCNLSKNFTMLLRSWEIKGERKPFMYTRTFKVILNTLTTCKDSPGADADVKAVWKSVHIFLRNHEGMLMHGRSGSEKRKRKANNNDDDDDDDDLTLTADQ